MTESPTFRSAALSHRKPTRFTWEPGAGVRADLAQSLDLQAVDRLRFAGEIRPAGRADFVLQARIEAQVTQSCVVTLAPVPARVAEDVTRRYLADWQDPEGDEVELPEDDSAEPLPEVIDISAVAREALALALPLYPRAPGADLGEAIFSGPGVEPLREEDLRPFAALKGLAGLVKPAKDESGEGGPGGGNG